MSRKPHSTGKLRQMASGVLLACPASLVSAPAWAHGDHAGVPGLLHVLASPGHLGGLLVAGLAASLVARRLPPVLRRIAAERARGASDREDPA